MWSVKNVSDMKISIETWLINRDLHSVQDMCASVLNWFTLGSKFFKISK